MRLQTLREAWLPASILLILLAFGAWLWTPLAVLTSVLLLGVLAFFRDPHRVPPKAADVVVSSADGVVTHVEQTSLDDVASLRISVFLSVLNVHVNRAPCSGRIVKRVWKPGCFHDARSPMASTANENQTWWFETPHGIVVLRQIAGRIARRIVAWRNEGDSVALAERIGMIRFGSRTDIFLPPHAIALVGVGDRVQGGLSIVARFEPTPNLFGKNLRNP